MKSVKSFFLIIVLFVMTSEVSAQIFTGGGLGVSFNDGYVIELAPVFGYRYKIIEAGFAPFFSYIESNQKYAFGGRIHSAVTIYEGVYAQAEFEVANSEVLLDGIKTRKWVMALPLGAGYRQHIGNGVNAYVTILYNVLQTSESHTKNPIVRAGVTYDL
ncbi:MAG: hypothetical protein PHT69_04340 [Bacteroidales bacterium]|nr:hypothetical protein [Bacteroidales bacterium]